MLMRAIAAATLILSLCRGAAADSLGRLMLTRHPASQSRKDNHRSIAALAR